MTERLQLEPIDQEKQNPPRCPSCAAYSAHEDTILNTKRVRPCACIGANAGGGFGKTRRCRNQSGSSALACRIVPQ